MLRILIADDHAVVRKGLRDTFNELGDMRVVAEASRGREVLPQLQKQAVDLVILDIGLPGRSGLEVLEEVKRRYPRIAVLIFTIHAEEEFAVTAMKSGAAGYLTKESPVEASTSAPRSRSGWPGMSMSRPPRPGTTTCPPANTRWCVPSPRANPSSTLPRNSRSVRK